MPITSHTALSRKRPFLILLKSGLGEVSRKLFSMGPKGEVVDLHSMDENKRGNAIIEAYERGFKGRFQHAPSLTDEDRAAVRSFVGRWAGKKDQIRDLVDGFFELDDEWLRNAGFPLKFLESRVNAIWVKKPSTRAKPLYVVALSESGVPVVSHNPQGLTPGFQVVGWEEWERTHEGK